MDEINCAGLRQILRRYSENGRWVGATHWSMAHGGYDLWWELYYDNVPVIGCCAGDIENYCLDEKQFKKAKKIILEEYSELKKYDNE